MLDKTLHQIDWTHVPTGLLSLGKHPSYRRDKPYIQYQDPYVAEAFYKLLPARTKSDVFNYWRPEYDAQIFHDNLMKYSSARRPKPEDWDEFNRSIDHLYHYEFESLGFNDFDKIEVNWQARAGYGYGNSKKSDPEAIRRAFRTAAVLILNHHKGIDLTLGQYTPDEALVKPEPSPKDKFKLRPVWGVAFHNFVVSALSGQPAMNAAPTLLTGYPIVHNVDPLVDIPKYYAYLEEKYPDYNWYQVDWSSFDADVQLFESDTYDQAMNKRIKFNGDELAAAAWNFTSQWRSHGTVISPLGDRHARNGNVGSGDSLTYHKDGETNNRKLRYLLEDFNRDYCDGKAVITSGGDDAIIGIPRNLNPPLHQLSEDAFRIFNAKLNVSKFKFADVATDLSLFKVEVNPGFHAQRRLDETDVLGRALCPLTTPESGAVSTARIRMICESSGWSIHHLNSVYLYLKSKYGEVDRTLLPFTQKSSLERAKVYKRIGTSKISTILIGS
jgi:hypothetical protein